MLQMMPIGGFEARILLETARTTSGNLGAALDVLQGCWKSSSLLWMHVNRLPVLSGLIVGGWSPRVEEAIIRFSRERGFPELLVRIEKPSQRWTHRRGGYTVPLKDVQSLVQTLAGEEMIAILLEPASPYSDLFSLTSVCEVDAGKVDIEVVGSGFDASDILRADITPHERFEVRFDNSSGAPWDRQKLEVRRTHSVDREGYRASVRRRLAKIGARLRNPSFPGEWMEAGNSESVLEDLAQEAVHFLRESGQTALLGHSDTYEPLPPRLLDGFLRELLRLSRAVAESKVPWRKFSLAGSFLSEDRLVIWDFFPLGDHDVRTLSHLRA
jgi:hypothetical protein